MKKNYVLVTALIATLLMTSGCGKNESSEPSDTNTTKSEKIAVDKGLLNVEVTIPAEYLGDEDEETIRANAKEKNIKEVTINKDGSVTYLMSRSTHKKLLENMKQEMEKNIQDMPTDTTIRTIEYNNDFSKYELTVDREAYENSFDKLAILGLSITSAYYTAFSGNMDEDFQIIFDIYDVNTGEKYDTVTLPDDLKEEEQ